MSNIILIWSLVILGIIGVVAATILFFVAKRFKVEENPLIDEVESLLSGANCGGCGFAGCRNFAEACVKASVEKKSLDGLHCLSSDMDKVAGALGLTASAADPMVAVVRCNGTCDNAPSKVHYEGASLCAYATTLYSGESGCPNGCLGLGDCVMECKFDAIHINKATGIVEVDDEKCVGCGACAKACPRGDRDTRQRQEEPPYLCGLQQHRERCRCDEELQRQLYRLQEMLQHLRVRSHRDARQPRIYRLDEVQAMPQMRGSMPARQHRRAQLPTEKT